MSVAKNTLVSGPREKSLEIMVLCPPPQAGRTSVCDHLSSRESSSPTTPALPRVGERLRNVLEEPLHLEGLALRCDRGRRARRRAPSRPARTIPATGDAFCVQTHVAVSAYPQTSLPHKSTAYHPILYCWHPVA